MRGRKPVSTHLKLIKGNPGKRALGSEPQPQRLEQVPEPPAFLLPEAQAVWRQVALHTRKSKKVWALADETDPAVKMLGETMADIAEEFTTWK